MNWIQSKCESAIYCKLLGFEKASYDAKIEFVKQPHGRQLELVTSTRDSLIYVVLEKPGFRASIGYLPRHISAELIHYMSIGSQFSCVIIDSDPRWPSVKIHTDKLIEKIQTYRSEPNKMPVCRVKLWPAGQGA